MSSDSIILSWNEAKDKKVKSSDDKDLGKVQNVTRDYIEIKEGLISKRRTLSQSIMFKDMTVTVYGYPLQKRMQNKDLREKVHLKTCQNLKLQTICKEENQ